MTDDLAAASGTDRRELMYRTLETIKHVPLAGSHYLERQVIVISTHFACLHKKSPLL
jgi:hypothetical protein